MRPFDPNDELALKCTSELAEEFTARAAWPYITHHTGWRHKNTLFSVIVDDSDATPHFGIARLRGASGSFAEEHTPGATV
jgi:hypothetical protein